MLRRFVITSALAAAVVVPTATVAPANAQALLTGIKVTVSTLQCPKGGNVSRVNVAIDTPGTSGSNWTGDTVTGLKAFYGNNDLHGSNFCSRPWFKGGGYYWYWSARRWFSFDGQRTYV